jgi:hypothetical protein
MSGFGFKNNLRMGFSSRRIHRISPRCVSYRVDSSNAKFWGGGIAAFERRNWSIRSERTLCGVEKLLELDVRQLANLLLGVIDAPLLADAGSDLAHDLLDVDAV